MNHPALLCLFAVCCVLTINCFLGAATFNRFHTSCSVSAFVQLCLCSRYIWHKSLIHNKNTNPWCKSGISIIAYVLSMLIVFVVYSVFQLYSYQASNLNEDITFHCNLAANMVFRICFNPMPLDCLDWKLNKERGRLCRAEVELWTFKFYH